MFHVVQTFDGFIKQNKKYAAEYVCICNGWQIDRWVKGSHVRFCREADISVLVGSHKHLSRFRQLYLYFGVNCIVSMQERKISSRSDKYILIWTWFINGCFFLQGLVEACYNCFALLTHCCAIFSFINETDTPVGHFSSSCSWLSSIRIQDIVLLWSGIGMKLLLSGLFNGANLCQIWGCQFHLMGPKY